MKLFELLKSYNALCLVAALLLSAFHATAEESFPEGEKKKEICKTFRVNSSDEVCIDNRYGSITVTHWDKKEIEIRVVIEAKAKSERRANELLDNVRIELDHSGNTVYGKTTMKKFGGTRNNERLSINYYISKPSKMEIQLSQQYGNINLPSRNDAYTQLKVQYGNIQGGDFSNRLDVECKYGNLTVKEVDRASFDLSYCGEAKIGNAGQIDIESRYSNIKMCGVENLTLDQSYGNFETEAMTNGSIDARYSNGKIRLLRKSCTIESAYGSVEIKGVSSSFEGIDAEMHYGSLTVALPRKMDFDVLAEEMKYGKYDISGRFNAQTERNKDNNEYYSKVNNGNSRRRINFEGNRYSNLKIVASPD